MSTTHDISITAYTRSSDTRKRLHVKTYPAAMAGLPKMMEVRVGDVCLYLDVNDARVMADAMLAEVRQAAAA